MYDLNIDVDDITCPECLFNGFDEEHVIYDSRYKTCDYFTCTCPNCGHVFTEEVENEI